MMELKNNELQDVQQEETYKSGSVQCIDSREVAEMVGKDHNKLLRDIRTYIEQLGASKIGYTDFFTESTYQSSQNKTMPCYLVTRKGCEFIAHKLTGTKGTIFTVRYINRFHEMEDELNASRKDTSNAQIVSMLKQFLERQDKLEKMIFEKTNSKKIYVDDIEEDDYVPFPIVEDGNSEITLRKKLLNGRISAMAEMKKGGATA